MKRIVYSFCFLLVAISAQAANSFSVGIVEIMPGEEKTLSVILTNDVEAQSAAIDISLPTGLSFVGSNGSVVFSDRVSGMMLKSAKIQKSGALRIGLALGETITEGTGEVFTFKIKADEGAVLGVVKMTFSEMSLTDNSSGSEKVTIPDAEIEVNIYDLTNLELTETGGITLLNNLLSGQDVNVTFKRSFTKDVSSTICLPFSLSGEQAAVAGAFYEFAGIDKTTVPYWTVVMQEAVSGNLVANKPYLFVPASTGQVTFCGTVEKGTAVVAGISTVDEWIFTGTYETIEWPSDPGTIYGFASGQAYGDNEATEAGTFIRVHSGGIRPFRAYLNKQTTQNSPIRGSNIAQSESLPERMSVRLLASDGNMTGTVEINANTVEISVDNDAWYTIDGLRLETEPVIPGAYIKQSRIVLIK